MPHYMVEATDNNIIDFLTHPRRPHGGWLEEGTQKNTAVVLKRYSLTNKNYNRTTVEITAVF